MADVVAVIGVGGLGAPCARRLGACRQLVVGDVDTTTLERVTAELTREGHAVTAQALDVADRAAVGAFATQVSRTGSLRGLVLAAGLSPHMGTPERIFAVNMLGTINVLDAFLPLAGSGTVAIAIASNAGYMAPVPAEVERRLALDPAETLMDAVRKVKGWDNGLGAYWLSKRATQLRVEAAAPAWGRKGARVVTISPGVMATPMSAFERDAGSLIDEAVANVPAQRIGVADEIAAAAAWLMSHEAAFVTGTDILVDGGMTSALRWSSYKTQDPISGERP